MPEEIELKRIDGWEIYNKFCENGMSGGRSLAEYLVDAQYQSDLEAFNKLKAELEAKEKIVADWKKALNAQIELKEQREAEISQLKADKKQMIEDAESTLDLYDNEDGFVGFSNHVPYSNWQSFKERWLK